MGRMKQLIIDDDLPGIVNLAEVWEEIRNDPDVWSDSEDTSEGLKDVLRRGRENALSASTLCAYFGTDRRSISRTVAAARKSGLPVCASVGENPGYYLARNKKEMLQYCRSLESRIRELQTVRQCCRDTLGELPK